MPRSFANPDMSANGSMKTLVPSAVRVKADWPCHSTRMLFLQSRDLGPGRLGLIGVVVAAAAEQGCAGGDQAGEDGEGEGRGQAVAERPGDQMGKEGVPGQSGLLLRRQRGEHVGPDQVLDRVVAQEGREQ